MNQFDRPRAVTNSSNMLLLSHSRDMAATHLSAALIEMLSKATDELFDLSEKASSVEMRNLYMETMSLSRDQRDTIGSDFKVQFTQSFTKEARKDLITTPASSNSFSEFEFSLVDPDDLEESLASINIANNLHGTCAEELFGIEKRIGALLQDPELADHTNPLGPEVIGAAFMEALKQQGCSVKIKLLLVKMFNKHMPKPTKDMYQEINQHLVENGILPKIRVGMKKRATTSEAHAVNPQINNTGTAATQSNSGEQGLFATLQQLMSLGSGGGIPATGFAGNGAFPQGVGTGNGMMAQGGISPANSNVMAALNRLQHGHIEGFAAEGSALSASAIHTGRTNVLREIRTSPVASSLGHVDAMTLDIVAMLFDYILDDRNIPDAMKALIGRLQIPVLKVAMLDKTFFSHKSHPARKFLDTLAGAAIGWNEEEGHQSGLYLKVDSQVQRVLNEFEDKVGIFTEVYEELSQFLAIEKQYADELTGRSAKIVHHKEQEEIAKIMAHDAVRQRVQSQHLPEVIRNFLATHWKPVLTSAYILTGEGSVGWNNALNTMDDLIWSAIPKVIPEDRKKLVSMLPSLLKRLQDGMAVAAMAENERNQFFAKLVKCHAEAVKSGLQTASQEAMDSMDAFDLELPISAQTPSEFQEISMTDSPFEAGSNLTPILDIDMSEPSEFSLADETDSKTSWQAQQHIAEDDYDAMVTHLKRGTWIEFTHHDDTHTRAKLAWVSPMKGLYLFTNRLGERAVSITPAGLAAKFRNGHAEIINDEALVDRAVSNLLERLKQPNAMTV